MKRGILVKAGILAVIGVAAVVSGGSNAGRRGAQEELDLYGAGRIVINLWKTGELGGPEDRDDWRGICWPGEDGVEFLGSGGLIVRFEVEGERRRRTINPCSFEIADNGPDKRILHEGCEGGKRHPNRDCDDDDDGLTDEDPYDGLDNDGDGLVDEDFAAIGDEMAVTRAIEPETGLVLEQSSYSWSYGHVRDFVGFTTSLGYPKEMDGRAPEILNLEAAVYVDFQIGERGDSRRGEDDKFFFVCGASPGYEEGSGLSIIAATDSDLLKGAMAAVIILDIRGPDGSFLGAEGSIIEALADLDSVWDATPVGRGMEGSQNTITVLPGWCGDVKGDGGKGVVISPSEAGTYSVVNECEGDMAVVQRLQTVPRFKPGETLKIEWALVFGGSEGALLRNARRAIETYIGVEDESGLRHRWVVPARKAVLREFGASLAAVWIQGRKQSAAAITIPPELEFEDVEWIRVGLNRLTAHERIGPKIVIPLDQELVGKGDPFEIEGQLTDGTIFTAAIDREILSEYGTGESLPPGSLPENSMTLFPNPFVATLNIYLHVHGPSSIDYGEGGTVAEGLSSVRIYNVQGRLVRTVLEEEFLNPGDYSHVWDGLDDYGVDVTPGVYYCKLQIGAKSLTKRVILLR